MQTKIIQIENIEAEELINRFERLENAVTALTSQPQQTAPVNEYLSRRDVAKMFNVSLVTITDWVDKGILKAYKLGSRVYFKSSEVESALIKKGGCNA